MKKIIFRFLIFTLLLIFGFITYLSTIGIKTDVFNDQISKEIKKREEESQNVESSKSEIGWGHQIRSYVLQPYRLVKDNRTNFESTSPDKVLDGDIDSFLEQSLYQIK